MRRIAHISDLHFGRHSDQMAKALLTSLHHQRPDLIIISGDLTQRARHAEFAEAQLFLSRLTGPKLLVPGNHDVPLYNIFRRFLTPFTKYDNYVGAMGQPANFFRDEEIAVLGLNTARRFTWKNGRVSLEQMAEVGRVLGDIPEFVVKVVVTHHPLAMPNGETPIELAGRSWEALRAIEGAGVHLLLSGHHHHALAGPTAELDDAGSMLVLHAGTAISSRTRGVEGNTYNLIYIEKGKTSVRVMEWTQNMDFRERHIVAYAFKDGRWRSVPNRTSSDFSGALIID